MSNNDIESWNRLLKATALTTPVASSNEIMNYSDFISNSNQYTSNLTSLWSSNLIPPWELVKMSKDYSPMSTIP